eukprot:7377656-Prymnesium_polylepis.1
MWRRKVGEGRRELKSQGQRQRAQRTGQPGDQILVENGPTGRTASVSAVCLQAARAFTSRRTPLFERTDLSVDARVCAWYRAAA